MASSTSTAATMEKAKRSGCWFPVILGVVILAGLMAVPLLWFFRSASTRKAAEQEHMREAFREASGNADERGSVTLTPESIASYSAADSVTGLTREHFVAMVADNNTTALARETFAKRANGQVVRWLLRISDVSEQSESPRLIADFELPYRIMNGPHGWTGSSIGIRAEFPEGERERLLKLRRGDWVTVEGSLRLNDTQAAQAKLVDSKLP